MPTTDSLFSLEIHVESVEELQLICRLPAVSFRLLDFPTLIIHLVAPVMAEKLRQKVLMGTGANESSLKELKDRRGNFQFQKGKSCLFKANIDVLQAQLQTTPLYVMLLDLWPKKPKLVGSGGIEIKTAIDVIHKHVRAKGVAIPSFYKEFGDFDLFNLMGSAIAKVKLGYRLVSLGGSLIPHVPRTMGSRRPGDSQGRTNIEENILEECDIVVREPAEVELKKLAIPEMKEVAKHQDMHTQTLPVQNSDGHDLIVTNTVCPPPLYFNSLSETHTKSDTESHKGAGRERPTCNTNTERAEDDADTESHKGAGRESPTYNTNTEHAEDDAHFAYDYAAGLVNGNAFHCTSVTVQTDPTVNRTQQTATGPQDGTETHQTTGGLQSLFTVMGSFPSRYPVLNALLQELSSVTTQQHNDESKGASSSREASLLKHNKETQRLTTMPPKILQKGATTTQNAAVPISKKSVIGLPRQRIRFKPTNLMYKTTRTQQMRLELNLTKGQVDKVRPCSVAVNQDSEQHGTSAKQIPRQTPAPRQTHAPSQTPASRQTPAPRQTLASRQTPAPRHTPASRQTPAPRQQMPARDLGRTYKKDLDQVGKAGTIVSTVVQTGAIGTKYKRTSTDREVADTATQLTEAQRTSENIVSPAGSVVGSARSYTSQNSLEIFLPTADEHMDDSSYTEEVLHPPPDSKFGYTGIPALDAVVSDIQLQSTVTAHHEDFDDTMPWHDNKTDNSAHSSLDISESNISDNTPKQHGAGKSEHCRPLISKSPQKISRSHRPKSADSLIQKVSLSDANTRETRSSTDLFNSEEIPQKFYNKQSLSSESDESYSDDFHSGSEVQQGEDSDSHMD